MAPVHVLSAEDVDADAPHVIKNYIRSEGQFTDLLCDRRANAAAKMPKFTCKARSLPPCGDEYC